MKTWLQDNDQEIYSVHNEVKFIVSKGSVRALKDKIYKYMTAIWQYQKDEYIDKLDDKYINTQNRTIKRKPTEVNSGIYFDLYFENNDKDPKFKVGNLVRVSKYKNISENV